MARNIFQDGMAAFDDSYDRTAKVFGDVARRKAGAALATGDRARAAGALGADGEVDAVRTLQRDQAGEDQQAYQRQRQGVQDQQATDDRAGKAMLEALEHVAQLPEAERPAAMQHPVWQALGVTPEMLAKAKPEDFSDQALAQFREQVKASIINLGNGGVAAGYAEPGKPARLDVLRQPDPPPLIVREGSSAIDRDTGKVLYSKAKTFAPPRARSGGSGGGLSGVKTEDLIAALHR